VSWLFHPFSAFSVLLPFSSFGRFNAIFSEGSSGCAPRPNKLSRGLGGWGKSTKRTTENPGPTNL